MIRNPWLGLPQEPPYVLEGDISSLDEFDNKVKPEFQVHRELLPEPFIGNVQDASVVLLNMNPAYEEAERTFHLDPAFRSIARANLAQAPLPHPFYFLDPSGRSPGHLYWSGRLAELGQACGGWEPVAKHIAVVEWYPYHSLEMSRSWMPRVPSQAFSFRLVQDAIDRGAVIIIIRAVKWWQQQLPGLVAGATPLAHNYRRGGRVLRRACPDGFQAAVDAIKAAEKEPS
jgi:hypothetical protein